MGCRREREIGVILLEAVFWLLAGILFYTYLGYGMLVIFLGRMKNLLTGKKFICLSGSWEPPVTLLIPAFNEKEWLRKKVENSLDLDYPPEKLNIMVITDGSDDGSPELLRRFSSVRHLHEAIRRGKMSAINRAMKFVDNEIVIFSDANAMLNKEAIHQLIRFFQDPGVGCVCGEKRVEEGGRKEVVGSGEGVYWRYESLIRQGEASLGSCVSATGELFAIRRSLYEDQPADTILDDFSISLGIALKGYRIQYTSQAYAVETASIDLGEEFKRKTRIAAGLLQSFRRMPELFHFLRHGRISFQCLSHKALRTLVAPFCFALLIPVNLALLGEGRPLFGWIFLGQTLFYSAAAAGYLLERRRPVTRCLSLPLYITFMNLATLVGIWRFLGGRQSVLWDKATRVPGIGSEEGQHRG